MCLWLRDETRGRGRQREARLHARRVHRGASCTRQEGLRGRPHLGASTRATAIIDKGIPTAGLLAQVLVAKHADHLPLYRQEAIFARAGLAISRATLGAWVGQCGARLEPVAQALKAELLRCQVLHADETPVAMLAPGRGKTQRAYLWAYASARTEPLKTVVYDFAPGRSGEHARIFLGHDVQQRDREQVPWTGHLVCDDFSGYKALFELGVVEVGCMAHYLEHEFMWSADVAVNARPCGGWLTSPHIMHLPTLAIVGVAEVSFADRAAHILNRRSLRRWPAVEPGVVGLLPAAPIGRLRSGAAWQLLAHKARRYADCSLVLPPRASHVQPVA